MVGRKECEDIKSTKLMNNQSLGGSNALISRFEQVKTSVETISNKQTIKQTNKQTNKERNTCNGELAADNEVKPTISLKNMVTFSNDSGSTELPRFN